MEESDWCDTSYIKAEQHQSSWCWSDAKLAGDLTSGEEEVSTREATIFNHKRSFSNTSAQMVRCLG